MLKNKKAYNLLKGMGGILRLDPKSKVEAKFEQDRVIFFIKGDVNKLKIKNDYYTSCNIETGCNKADITFPIITVMEVMARKLF